MKKILLSTGLLFLAVSFTCCQSPAGEIRREFDKVNQSLIQAQASDTTSVENVYRAINSKRKANEQLASGADSVYFVATNTSKFLDSIKTVMKKTDPSVEDLDVSTKLLVDTKTGKDVIERLLHVQRVVSAYATDNTTTTRIAEALQPLKKIQSEADWTRKYFLNTPTVGALTILTKYEYDCMDAALIVLNDINRRLSN